jgi:hypothetical protein
MYNKLEVRVLDMAGFYETSRTALQGVPVAVQLPAASKLRVTPGEAAQQKISCVRAIRGGHEIAVDCRAVQTEPQGRLAC